MAVIERRKCGLIGGILAPGALLGLGVEGKFLEKDLPDLLGRGDIEVRYAGHFPHLRLVRGDLFPKVARESVQLGHVHLDAGHLHLPEHLRQRLFHLEI